MWNESWYSAAFCNFLSSLFFVVASVSAVVFFYPSWWRTSVGGWKGNREGNSLPLANYSLFPSLDHALSLSLSPDSSHHHHHQMERNLCHEMIEVERESVQLLDAIGMKCRAKTHFPVSRFLILLLLPQLLLTHIISPGGGGEERGETSVYSMCVCILSKLIHRMGKGGSTSKRSGKKSIPFSGSVWW